MHTDESFRVFANQLLLLLLFSNNREVLCLSVNYLYTYAAVSVKMSGVSQVVCVMWLISKIEKTLLCFSLDCRKYRFIQVSLEQYILETRINAYFNTENHIFILRESNFIFSSMFRIFMNAAFPNL